MELCREGGNVSCKDPQLRNCKMMKSENILYLLQISATSHTTARKICGHNSSVSSRLGEKYPRRVRSHISGKYATFVKRKTKKMGLREST